MGDALVLQALYGRYIPYRRYISGRFLSKPSLMVHSLQHVVVALVALRRAAAAVDCGMRFSGL
jgi:hypothetical protein